MADRERKNRKNDDERPEEPAIDSSDTLGPASERDSERFEESDGRERPRRRDADDIAAADGYAEVVEGIPGREAGGDDDGRVAEEVREQKRSKGG